MGPVLLVPSPALCKAPSGPSCGADSSGQEGSDPFGQGTATGGLKDEPLNMIPRAGPALLRFSPSRQEHDCAALYSAAVLYKTKAPGGPGAQRRRRRRLHAPCDPGRTRPFPEQQGPHTAGPPQHPGCPAGPAAMPGTAPGSGAGGCWPTAACASLTTSCSWTTSAKGTWSRWGASSGLGRLPWTPSTPQVSACGASAGSVGCPGKAPP